MRNQRMTSWHLVYAILRANFDGATGSALSPRARNIYVAAPARPTHAAPCAYVLDTPITRIESDKDKTGVRLWLSLPTGKDGDGERVEQETNADLVVVADGPSSLLRAQLLQSESNGEEFTGPPPQRTYAGYVAMRGLVDEQFLTPLSRWSSGRPAPRP